LSLSAELRPFETEIISNFKVFSPISGGGKSRPRKGVWIRQHLLDVGEDYVGGMWKKWTKFVGDARKQNAEIEFGTYDSFRTYVYLLKKHGMIVPTRRERAKSPDAGFFRQFYRLNTRRLEDPTWLNPYATYPSWRKWQRKGFPRPKRKPRALHRRKYPPPPGLIPAVPVPPSPRISPVNLDRIWNAARAFLRQNKYAITREELEEIMPDWPSYLEELNLKTGQPIYRTFKEKVGFVIHEAVEIETVSLIRRELYDPRKAPEAVRRRGQEKADAMEKKWLRS
jgi:hypothetical protein